MAANGGLAEPKDNAASDQVNEGLRQQNPQPQTTTMRHIRIVHSADHPGGSSAATREVRSPRQGRAGGSGGGSTTGKSDVLLDRSIQGQIGRMLRDVFSDVAKEPVPDRFVELLEALADQEKQQ